MRRPPGIAGIAPIREFPTPSDAERLGLDEYEAIRLTDYERRSQEEAARAMGVSRPTLTRIVESARRKIAAALIEGTALAIEGGEVSFAEGGGYCRACRFVFDANGDGRCPVCRSADIEDVSANDIGAIMARHRNRGEGLGMGTGGGCVCVKCGETAAHQAGIPCRQQRCPKCGAAMIREGSEHHQLFLKKQAEKKG